MSNADHTARPESWGHMTQMTDNYWADCLLEIRARVEWLEQAQHAQPAGGLVEPEITGRELIRIWNDNEDPNEDAGDAMARLYTAGFHAGMKWQAEMMEQAQQQPAPRYNLRFRGFNLIPPIDCPDSLMWIAERAYQMGKEQPNCPHIRSNGDGSSYCSLAEGNSSASLTSSAPEPSTPAELVSDVAELIARFASSSRAGDDCTPAASEVLHKVADWLADKGAIIGPDLLRREVGR